MDKLQSNLSHFANEIEKTRELIKQRKDKLATTQEVYIPQNHTFSHDGREFNTREHFSILKQRSLNNQDDDFNGFDTLMREAIENALNIKPIKEFGTNYAEHYHSGESAIQKLISEAQAHKESGAKTEYKGQVAGAFHRKELGDIDLVWGDSNFGLAHILQQRTKQWGEEKALRFISHLSENIQKGHIVEVEKGRIGIKTELTTIILDKKDGNNFVITAFRDSGNKKELESLNLIQSKALTSENAGTNAKESPVTSLNQDAIIPQTTQEIIKQAKASGKSVAETKELIQKNKELQEANAQKIQEVKEKLKQLNKESRDLAYNAPAPKYLGKGYTKTRDKKYLDYRSRFRNRLKENGIGLDYMELEKLKQDTTLKGKAKKEAMDTIYLRMYENMQQADKEAKERVRVFNQKIREEELQEANEWLEKNKGASSDVDYEYKRKIAEIDKHLDFSFKHHPNDTDFIDLMNRERGKLTYAKNGDLGVVRLPEVEKFYRRGYPMDLKMLRDIQKEHNYTDKNLILNGRDFSKSFEVMRAEIEARIGINPIKEFGTNYAEHYHSGETAIQKLISEAQAHKESGAKGEYKGQVAGAFHRKELGDIDLVWGNDKIGLQKIVEKHLKDFADFAGNNPYEKMSNAINEIVENGKLLTENGVNTLWYKNGDEYYLVGISKGFNKKGDNNWVITSYKKDNITDLQKEKVDKLFSSDAEVLSAQGKFNELETLNSTTSNIIPQTPQEIIKQAKASGKSVAETKELIQKNKELQKHNNTESTPPLLIIHIAIKN